MDESRILKEFDIESIKRLKETHGWFDTLALSAHYNYSVEELQRGSPNATKTMLHETMHLYQMLSTPYGYYYYSLRDFQNNQIIAIMRLLRDTHGIKLKFPLVDLIARLEPREKFSEVWFNLYLWYLAEFMLLFFEGNSETLNKQLRNNPLLHRLFPESFAELEFYLVKYYAAHGRKVQYDGHNLNFVESASQQDFFMLFLKLFFWDVSTLFENWAKLCEYWGSEEFPDTRQGDFWKYHIVLSYSKSRLEKAANFREFALSLFALLELSVFSPILPHYSQLRGNQSTFVDLHPSIRLIRAIGAAAKIEPIQSLSSDYVRFVEEVCNANGWATPFEISEATLSQFPYAPQDFLSDLYYKAQRFRQRKPWAFIDLSYWFLEKDDFIREFTYYFVHPIIEFSDKVLVHKNKELAGFFVTKYMLSSYLRKVLLSNDLSITLPYRASEADIKLLHDILLSNLRSIGIRNPKVLLKSAPL